MNGTVAMENFLQKLVLKKTFWLFFIGLGFAIPIFRTLNRELPPPLPVHYKINPYELTNQFGQPFGSQQLMGKVYIANFMFTNCPTSCKKMIDVMKTVQKRVKGVGTKNSHCYFFR